LRSVHRCINLRQFVMLELGLVGGNSRAALTRIRFGKHLVI